MKILMTATLLAASVTASAAESGDARKLLREEQLAARKDAHAQQLVATAAAPATVGDADSYGRYVKFIGLMNTGVISLADDCTPDPAFPPGPEDHCIVPNPAPALTSFTINDAARVLIPAKSANSLFCHWQTPFVSFGFSNPTGVDQPAARIILTPTYVIQNPVLNDPALVDPTTGVPLAGSITVSLPGVRRARSLHPGEVQVERENGTRVCDTGIVSKALLASYGLSAAQQAAFFKADTVITMNLVGSARLVNFASVIYGTRFVGD
jgi:hypothetical protein